MPKRRGNGEGSLYQDRKGRWCALLTVGHDENGKRRRRYLYGVTKAEVLEKLHATRSHARAGLLVEPSRTTVGEFVSHWLKTSALGEHPKPAIDDHLKTGHRARRRLGR